VIDALLSFTGSLSYAATIVLWYEKEAKNSSIKNIKSGKFIKNVDYKNKNNHPKKRNRLRTSLQCKNNSNTVCS
jgi:hypothetical protein